MNTIVVGTHRVKVQDNLFAQKKVMNAYIMMQIAFDEIECLTDTTLFKMQNKARIVNTLKWLEGVCTEMTGVMNIEENAGLTKSVDSVRELLRAFEISYDKKLEDYERGMEKI